MSLIIPKSTSVLLLSTYCYRNRYKSVALKAVDKQQENPPCVVILLLNSTRICLTCSF